MLRVVSVLQGIQLVAKQFAYSGDFEWVPLSEAVGRRLAQPLAAGFSVPHYRRSTVDGYAVRARDVVGAGESSPALLPMAFAVEMGEAAREVLKPNTCAYVPTGGHVPDGADAMVMVEYTQDFGSDRVIEKSVAVGDHIVQIGEDVKEGQVLIEEDVQLAPRHLGLLSTLGYTHVPVRRRLTAVVLATGDEIAKPPTGGSDGMPRRNSGHFGIYDANNALITSSLSQWDVTVVSEEFLADTPEAFSVAIGHWNGRVDVVLLSGGSSQGVKDLTEKSISQLDNAQLLLHGLAIQPGKPTIVGCTDKTLYIGLPGHPGACYTTLRVFVEPLLLCLRSPSLVKTFTESSMPTGETLYDLLGLKTATAKVDFSLHGASGRTVYQLVTLKSQGGTTTASAIYGKSGMVGALAMADGYVVLPKDTEGYRPGDTALAVYW